MRPFAIVAALMCLSAPAAAADFAIVNGLDKRPAVMIWGDIQPDDHLKFAAFVKTHPQVYSIKLQSDGGAIEPAIRIGTFAHILGLQTVVISKWGCASACALIWAGGTKRTLEPDAKVGFHGVFTMEDGHPQPSAPGNALVGAYLARLGYADPAISYMTAQPPTGMAWLTPDQGRALGIDYDIKQHPLARRASVHVTSVAPPAE